MARRGVSRLGGAGQVPARLGGAWLGEARRGFQLWEERRMKADVVRINKPTDIIIRKVLLTGLTPIMFDRYPGDNQTKLEPHQKLYLEPGGSPVIGLPATNFMSFLSAHNTNSAPKRLRDKRKFKDIANAMLSFVSIEEQFIPFLRDGKPIVFGKLEDDVDKKSGVWVHRSVARLDKGIPNPKVRPVLPTPWALRFTMQIFPNREIKEQDIQNLIEEGGRALGLGTFRGVFGKFQISEWN
jgi:hypothetical protein